MRELKNVEGAIGEINKIEELETKIIQSTKRKLSAIEKEKMDKTNELEEDLRKRKSEEKNKKTHNEL